MEPASHFLGPWSNFYILIGTAAASLTGLMFVVITIVTGTERLRKSPDGISTFSTPTVVHFGAALFASAIVNAPWHVLFHPAVLLGLLGFAGLAYLSRVTHRATRLTRYNPDGEDWAFYTILPFVAYGAIFVGAVLLTAHPTEALFALAAGSALLIFIGIRNAWDVVTFIATGKAEDLPED